MFDNDGMPQTSHWASKTIILICPMLRNKQLDVEFSNQAKGNRICPRVQIQSRNDSTMLGKEAKVHELIMKNDSINYNLHVETS